MRLIMDQGLQCRCGSDRVSLDNVWLQDNPYGYAAFTFYIYFRCDHCAVLFRYAHKKDQKRLTIRQKHLNIAIALNRAPDGGMNHAL